MKLSWFNFLLIIMEFTLINTSLSPSFTPSLKLSPYVLLLSRPLRRSNIKCLFKFNEYQVHWSLKLNCLFCDNSQRVDVIQSPGTDWPYGSLCYFPLRPVHLLAAGGLYKRIEAGEPLWVKRPQFFQKLKRINYGMNLKPANLCEAWGWPFS